MRQGVEPGLGLARMLDPARLWSDGIPLRDIHEADAVLKDRDEWFSFWARKGDEYEELGESALAAGSTLSAGYWLWLASLSYHYGQFMWFHDPATKEPGQRRKQDLYNRAAPHFRCPGERIEIQFEGNPLPGFLRLPDGDRPAGGWPCVVLLGGLESTKEESYLFENLCLERGLATFAFDGPGQGEFYFSMKLQPDFERYASAVVDYLVTREEIDSERLGVLGRSLGGHYATRCAAYDERFRACVSWGGSWSEEAWDELPDSELSAWYYVSGYTDDSEAGLDYLKRIFNLGDLADRLRVPTLAVLGEADAGRSHHLDTHVGDFPNTTLEIMLIRGGEHCCHRFAHIIRPKMADWVVSNLGARAVS